MKSFSFKRIPRTSLIHVLFSLFLLCAIFVSSARAEEEVRAASAEIAAVDAVDETVTEQESLTSLEETLAASPEDVAVIKRYATRLSHLGRFEEALEWFQRSLKLKPNDVEAMLGLARITGWAAEHDEAIRLYEDILRVHPDAVEAHLGLAYVWGWKQEYEKAREHADIYVAGVPDDPDGYLALARIYKWDGENAKSKDYYEKALVLSPGNQEAIEGMEQLSPPHELRIDTGYSHTSITRRDDWSHGFIQMTCKPNPKTVILGRADRHERFKTTDVTYRMELYRDIGSIANIHAGFWGTPDADFSPKTGILSEVSLRLPFLSSVAAGYTRLNYPAGGVDILTGELVYYFRDASFVSGKYYWTDSYSGVTTDSYSFRAQYDVTDSVILKCGYAHGAEATDILATGLAERIDSDTYSAGMLLNLSDDKGINIDYAFEKREGGFDHHTYGVSFFVKF